MRGALVRVHRHLGLATAAFLVLAGLTGSALVFQREIDAWLNPGLWAVARPGPSLSPGAIAARVEAADPRVTARWIPLSPRPAAAADVWVDWKPGADGRPAARGYDQMFVDPVTGAVNGTRAYGACCLEREHLIPFLYHVHSSLFMPGRAGAILLGIIGVLWTIDSLVGFALTLPAHGGGRHGWATSWRVKRHASGTRRLFDLHRAGGLWLWPLLIAMGVSSVALTLPHEVFEPVVAKFSPVAPEPWEGRAAAVPGPVIGFDRALAIATRAAGASGVTEPSTGIYLAPEARFYGVRFGAEEDAGVGQAWVYVDSGSGAIVEVVLPTSGSAGDVVKRAQLPIHAGRIGGLATRVLTAALGLAIAGLAITGVLVWNRKRRAARVVRGQRQRVRG